jgi:hypothetical protein
MAWRITKVYDPTCRDEEGVCGPRDATDEALKPENLTHPFRLYTDDGDLIYEGSMTAYDDERCFGPLDDFGTPNYGCTYMMVREGGTRGKWVLL